MPAARLRAYTPPGFAALSLRSNTLVSLIPNVSYGSPPVITPPPTRTAEHKAPYPHPYHTASRQQAPDPRAASPPQPAYPRMPPICTRYCPSPGAQAARVPACNDSLGASIAPRRPFTQTAAHTSRDAFYAHCHVVMGGRWRTVPPRTSRCRPYEIAPCPVRLAYISAHPPSATDTCPKIFLRRSTRKESIANMWQWWRHSSSKERSMMMIGEKERMRVLSLLLPIDDAVMLLGGVKAEQAEQHNIT
ncbi:hypothetical protein C8R44DRAFT_896444 [Mycena epipterygia]|nr:hypothetical protein C8R44DRAFT_896444 [Mycena epipterygia]